VLINVRFRDFELWLDLTIGGAAASDSNRSHLPPERNMDQRIIKLYDRFTHGDINRREFLDRVVELAGSSAGAMALLPLLQNNYAKAETVAANDQQLASAFGGKADIDRTCRNVRF